MSHIISVCACPENIMKIGYLCTCHHFQNLQLMWMRTNCLLSSTVTEPQNKTQQGLQMRVSWPLGLYTPERSPLAHAQTGPCPVFKHISKVVGSGTSPGSEGNRMPIPEMAMLGDRGSLAPSSHRRCLSPLRSPGWFLM